jgi:hypothetical protein
MDARIQLHDPTAVLWGNPQNQLDRRLAESYSQSRLCDKGNNLLLLPGIET